MSKITQLVGIIQSVIWYKQTGNRRKINRKKALTSELHTNSQSSDMSEKTSSVFEIWKDFISLAVSLEKSDHCVMIFFPLSPSILITSATIS